MSDRKELSQINNAFGIVRMSLEGSVELNNAIYELEQIAIQFNIWRNERAEMQAAICELRARLDDCRKEFWDDWHSCMSEEQFKEHWLIEDINNTLENTKKWSEHGKEAD